MKKGNMRLWEYIALAVLVLVFVVGVYLHPLEAQGEESVLSELEYEGQGVCTVTSRLGSVSTVKCPRYSHPRDPQHFYAFIYNLEGKLVVVKKINRADQRDQENYWVNPNIRSTRDVQI